MVLKMHSEVKVSIQSQPKVIESIRSMLNQRQMQLMNETCMKHIIHLPNIQQCGAIIHNLLLRVVDNGEHVEPSSMSFVIGGERLEFSRYEFALVLWLRMNPDIGLEDVVEEEDHRLRGQYFANVRKVNMQEMLDAIEQCENDADKVKLSLVCLLEFFLLGKDKQKTHIDYRHLQLVDNLEKFNAYPWGLVTHHRTINSLKKALTNTSTKYTLLGCPYILQVWAYERIVPLGQHFANKLEVTEAPKILHWRCGKTVRTTLLWSLCCLSFMTKQFTMY